MEWQDFDKRFPDEESCREEWKRIRESVGVVCPRCGNTAHYWKRDKQSFECKQCHYRQSLRSNTFMHGSQLPFRYWFIAVQLLTSTDKPLTALALQKQLGHKSYKPIWALRKKLKMLTDTMSPDELTFENVLEQGARVKNVFRFNVTKKS